MIFLRFNFVSCGDSEVSSTKNDGLKKSINQINIENENFIKADLTNFFKRKTYKTVANIGEISILKETSTDDDFVVDGTVLTVNQIFGPFNYTLTSSGVLQSDVQVVLNNSTGYATGVYFCDIYRFSANIPLPNNTTGWVFLQSITNQCYSNYSNQTIGYTYNITVNAWANNIKYKHILPKS